MKTQAVEFALARKDAFKTDTAFFATIFDKLPFMASSSFRQIIIDFHIYHDTHFVENNRGLWNEWFDYNQFWNIP